MHTTAVLHKLLKQSAPSIHAVRLTALMNAVYALTHCAQVSITSLGRHLPGHTFDKHKIKRMDRLVANPHRFLLKLARLLPSGSTPVIAADSGFKTPSFRYVE